MAMLLLCVGDGVEGLLCREFQNRFSLMALSPLALSVLLLILYGKEMGLLIEQCLGKVTGNLFKRK